MVSRTFALDTQLLMLHAQKQSEIYSYSIGLYTYR